MSEEASHRMEYRVEARIQASADESVSELADHLLQEIESESQLNTCGVAHDEEGIGTLQIWLNAKSHIHALRTASELIDRARNNRTALSITVKGNEEVGLVYWPQLAAASLAIFTALA